MKKPLNEIWRDIRGFEGFYQVSNLGRVKSLKRRGCNKERIRVFAPAGNGYLRMVLSANNYQRTISAHRAVAEAFIPNPSNLKTVNHKDFNKKNNCVENLEWVSHKDNILHSCNSGRHYHRPVQQLTLAGHLLKKWESAYKVETELGYFSTNISRCCRGKKKTYKNFKWRFCNEAD